MDENNKLINKIMMGKEAYEAYINSEGDKMTFDFVCNKYGIAIRTLNKYINLYRDHVVSPRPSDQDEILYRMYKGYNQVLKPVNNDKKEIVVESDLNAELRALDTPQKIEQFARTSVISTSDFQKHVIKTINENEDAVWIEKLKELLEIFKHIRLQMAQEKRNDTLNTVNSQNRQEKYMLMNSIINQYISSSDIEIDSIVVSNDMRYDYFKSHLDDFANYSLEYHQMTVFYQKVLENRRQFVLDIVKKINSKTFTILDYYRLSGSYDFKKFIASVNRLRSLGLVPALAYGVLNNFASVVVSINLSREELMGMDYSNNGMKLTNEDKSRILDFLEDNGIPLTKYIYFEACNAYTKNTLKSHSLS